MRQKLILLFFTLPLCMYAQAPLQKSIKITGTVIDIDTNQPLEYATIVLENIENSDVTGGITDSSGKFNIETTPGIYNIKIEYISYQTFQFTKKKLENSENLGTIKLTLDVAQLEAVEIVGEKTTVQIQLDKKVFNVGKDITSQGTDALNVLDNVPSVSVDVEGNISLRGNENVRVLINGRPSNSGMSGSDLLRQLPSDAIERVEVITNPSARYDAEGSGGILNIILKKGEDFGFNGSFQSTFGYYPYAQTSTNLNYKTNKFNLFSSLGYRYRKSPGGGFNNSIYYEGTSQEITGYLDQTRNRERKGNNYNVRIGGEYYFNDKNTLLASFSYNVGDNKNTSDLVYNNYDASRNLTSIRLRDELEKEDENRKQYNVNYESKFNEKGTHKLVINFNYETEDETENSTYTNNYTLGAGIDGVDTSLNHEQRNELLLQADYILPFNEDKGQFEAGYKSEFNDISSNVEVTINEVYQESLSNILDYDENIHAFYSQYGNKYGSFTFLAGLRMEISDISIKSILGGGITENKKYTNFFPTLHAGYELGENETIQLSYSRRIRRPRFWDLNPFYTYADDTNRISGNPNLNPMYTNAFEIAYLNNWDQFMLNASIYYQHSTDLFQRITVDTGDTFNIQSDEDLNNDGIVNGEDVEEIPILSSQPINTGEENRYGVETTISYNPFKWLRLSGDFNLYGFKQDGTYETYVNGDIETRKLDGENISWFTRINTQLRLPSSIGVQLRMFYNGPYDAGYVKNRSFLSINLGASKDLFNDKATINFNISDLLNTRKRRSETFAPTFYTNSEFQWRKRQVNISFIYRFNQKKERQRGEENGEGPGMED
ncbi:TonB-dependent receptor domain-containing protein [Abyssalbus ytuae]|uniref:TonB dependent receptor n=1 Tax=Abyssalbus ytuae TaxID=2926907 RepID=A0A9E7CZ90_9FLAO|nr:TonB-dependent receptor [Abyssalbus ytuae]UOB17350.1 TonB dependent receptor [Abyssalbus ytuae]